MIKRDLKYTLAHTIIAFLPLSFSFFITPLYTHYLDKSQLGFVNLFTVITGLMIPFYGLGIESSFSILFFEVRKQQKKVNALVSTTLILLFLISSFFTIFFYLFHDFLFPLVVKSNIILGSFPYLLLLLVLPFFSQVFNIFIAYYRNKEDIRSFAFLNVGSLLSISLFSLIGVVGLNLNQLGAIGGRILSYSFIGVISILIFFLRNKIEFDRAIAKRLLIIGLPVFIYLLIGQVNYSIDRIFVERFFNLSELGIFGLALLIASVVEIWIGALSNAMSPKIYKLMFESIKENALKIKQVLNYQYTSTLLVICLVISVSPFIMKYMIAPEYFDALTLIPLLASAFVGRAYYIMFAAVLFAKTKTKTLPLINLAILGVALISNYFLIPVLHLTGVAIATIITKLVQVPLTYLLSQKVEKFDYNLKLSGTLTLSFFLSLFVTYSTVDLIGPFYAYQIPFVTTAILAAVIYKNEIVTTVPTLFKRTVS